MRLTGLNVGVHRTLGIIGLKAGGGGAGGFGGNADALTVGVCGKTVLWDFEAEGKGKKNDPKLTGKCHDEQRDEENEQ